jgi:plasmid stabilization system protein ParE
MAFKLIWSPSARLDLKGIATFISGGSPSAAEKFVKSLFMQWRDWPISLNRGASYLSSTTIPAIRWLEIPRQVIGVAIRVLIPLEHHFEVPKALRQALEPV